MLGSSRDIRDNRISSGRQRNSNGISIILGIRNQRSTLLDLELDCYTWIRINSELERYLAFNPLGRRLKSNGRIRLNVQNIALPQLDAISRDLHGCRTTRRRINDLNVAFTSRVDSFDSRAVPLVVLANRNRNFVLARNRADRAGTIGCKIGQPGKVIGDAERGNRCISKIRPYRPALLTGYNSLSVEEWL